MSTHAKRNLATSLESSLREHFRTNYAPTDSEIERIRAHLVPRKAELARLESLIDELTVERNRLDDYIEPYRALISHSRRLPQAFAMPRLWAFLHISGDFVAQSKERTAAFVRWLNRSAPLPFMISLLCAYGYTEEVLEHLLDFSQRWSALRLSNLVAPDFCQLAGVNPPLLEDIQITLPNRVREGGWPADFIFVLTPWNASFEDYYL
ncbi:hypothetical protein DFH06DRAFT_1303282 [Mycena polygramma]|nr:hypothetical protein DFH06DRAFT_1303282 [Mycena polygramma]